MSEKISAEKKDKIMREAYEKLKVYGGEGRSVDKYAVDLKKYFEEQSGVKKATIRGRSTITVEFEDSTQIGFLLDRVGHYGGDGYQQSEFQDELPALPISLREIQSVWPEWWRWSWWKFSNVPRAQRALLFDPLYDDWPPEATTDSIEAALTHIGYTVEKMLGSDGDLAHLEKVESKNYGVIFIRSHGGVLVVGGDDKTHMMVRPFFDTPPDPASCGYYGVGVFYVDTNWGPKYAYAINEQFVRHHLGTVNFPNTLMHLLVCHGGDPLGEDDLIDAFRDFGVGAYTGWTRNASLLHGDPAAVAFFKYLCGGFGRTVNDAIIHIKTLGHSPDSTTGAELVCYGAANLSLLGLRRMIVHLSEEDLHLLRKFPDESLEIVFEPPAGIHIPDWSPFGGKLTPVDRTGHRRFVPLRDPIKVFGLEKDLPEEKVIEEAIEVFAL